VTSYEISLVLLSALLHAGWNFSTKGSRSPLAFALIIAAVTGGSLVVVLPFFDWRAIPTPVWWILVTSGVIHALYFFWLSRGYQWGELTLVYPIARSTPAFVPFLAVPLLGEHISYTGAFGIAVVVAGIWVVHAEGLRWRTLRHKGVLFALLTMGAGVVYSVLDKEGMARLNAIDWTGPAPRSVVYFVIEEAIMFVLLVPFALRAIGWATFVGVARAEYKGAIGAGLASFVSYALILEAFRTASVSYVVAARQVSVIFAVALAALFLRERPSRVRLLGVLATVVGVYLVSRG
jgi:drug/metabolite transporter (DMT)-like permease